MSNRIEDKTMKYTFFKNEILEFFQLKIKNVGL